MENSFLYLLFVVTTFEGLRLGLAYDFLALASEGAVIEKGMLRRFDVTFREARKVRNNLLCFFCASIPVAFLFGGLPYGLTMVIGLVSGLGFMLFFGPGLIRFCLDDNNDTR